MEYTVRIVRGPAYDNTVARVWMHVRAVSEWMSNHGSTNANAPMSSTNPYGGRSASALMNSRSRGDMQNNCRVPCGNGMVERPRTCHSPYGDKSADALMGTRNVG